MPDQIGFRANVASESSVESDSDFSPECPFAGCRNCPRSSSEPLCEGHYYQRRRGGPLRPLRAYGRLPRDCAVVDCPNVQKDEHCSKHAARLRRHGSTDVVIPHAARALPRGAEHPQWLSEPTYTAVHQRLARLRGPASEHTCPCGQPAAQWAYMGDRQPDERAPFSEDLWEYAPRCTSCHKRFDLSAISETSGNQLVGLA